MMQPKYAYFWLSITKLSCTMDLCYC